MDQDRGSTSVLQKGREKKETNYLMIKGHFSALKGMDLQIQSGYCMLKKMHEKELH